MLFLFDEKGYMAIVIYSKWQFVYASAYSKYINAYKIQPWSDTIG